MYRQLSSHCLEDILDGLALRLGHPHHPEDRKGQAAAAVEPEETIQPEPDTRSRRCQHAASSDGGALASSNRWQLKCWQLKWFLPGALASGCVGEISPILHVGKELGGDHRADHHRHRRDGVGRPPHCAANPQTLSSVRSTVKPGPNAVNLQRSAAFDRLSSRQVLAHQEAGRALRRGSMARARRRGRRRRSIR